MADKRRQEFVDEMNRIRQAIQRTDSEYLKRDYSKALKVMERELADYDRFYACREVKYG